MKPCILCGEEKPRSEFHRKRANADGHDNRCKECMREYAAAKWKERCETQEKPVKKSEPRPARPWEIAASPVDDSGLPLWEVGATFTPSDVRYTLKMGHFDAGMVLHQKYTGSRYTVAMIGDVQVLKNGRYCLVSGENSLQRVTPSSVEKR